MRVPTPARRHRLAKVFVKAADDIAAKREIYCCYALRRHDFTGKARVCIGLFYELFNADAPGESLNFWMQSTAEHSGMKKVRERRTLMLLLAAELVKDGSAWEIFRGDRRGNNSKKN